MTPYADTNFFTRIYLELPESGEAERLMLSAKRSEAALLPLTWLHRVELVNAFQLHVFQARQNGQTFISPQQASLAYLSLQDDARNGGYIHSLTVPPVDLEECFGNLSLRQTARHGFRTYDLLHVASALLLQCDTFWSFDTKATKLARLEGLKTR